MDLIYSSVGYVTTPSVTQITRRRRIQVMNWEGCVRKWLLPNFKVLSHNLSAGTEENYNNLCQDRRPTDMKPETSKQEAGLLTTRWHIRT